MNVVSPAPRELWSHVVKASPEALALHTPQWLDCICATGVYEDVSLAYEMVDDRKFILPLVRRKWLPSPLTTEASPPFGWGSAGPISTEVVRREELGAILVDLARRKALRVTVRPNPLAEQPATPPNARYDPRSIAGVRPRLGGRLRACLDQVLQAVRAHESAQSRGCGRARGK